jgi:hypothetical protein
MLNRGIGVAVRSDTNSVVYCLHQEANVELIIIEISVAVVACVDCCGIKIFFIKF